MCFDNPGNADICERELTFSERQDSRQDIRKLALNFLGRWLCHEKAQEQAHTMQVKSVCFREEHEEAQKERAPCCCPILFLA